LSRSPNPPPRRANPRRTPGPPSPAAEPRGERLQKLLAAAGLGSRRSIEEWIAAGRVTVSGRVARLGDRATAADTVLVDGSPVPLRAAPRAPRVLAYHKPVGELVTRSDPRGRRTVFASLPGLEGARWIPVGRLDLNSAGLLLFTDSGELANRLMHPRYAIEREYRVRVRGRLDEAQLGSLRQGVALQDGIAAFDRLEAADARSATGANRWYEVVLHEGRNREVRRLFEAVGAQVSRLLRVRYGAVSLPRDLAPGTWRELRGTALAKLLHSAGMAA
jgi:23S rRNA pseudouridine2605 synthase